ncbi:hypothetical protein LB507_003191 [Fusarium sp. FIESC RH6]|nr:hypothetical protein LB507_003191 [Fusarium sp. FIESC RH6]
MFSSSPNAAKSADNLAALSPIGHGELPFHSSNHRHPQMHPHPSARRGSTASSIHSVGGVLDSAPSSLAASVYESSQNAISTLLQPPIVRTGLQPHTSAPASTAHKPPTARDIPPVTLTNITKVDVQEFSPYLSKVGALYDQLQRLKESDEEDKEQRSDRQDTPTESSGDGYLRPGPKPRPTRKGSTASLSSMNSNDGQGPVQRPSAGFIRRSTQGPPPLSTIPTVYFDDEFHLENPRTFDIVSERSEVIRPANAEDGKGALNGSAAAPRKALATNAILQEKLSWYMDTIEVHLINSISTASTTFFTALGSLKELHSEAAESVERIKTLRKELEALDEEIATKGLQIVHQRRRQENLRKLNDAVLQLKQIADGVAGCETLVNEGEIDKALASIDSLEKLIAGERDTTSDNQPKIQLLDLRSASALQGVNEDLALLRSRIGKAYETNFQDILIRDLRRHVESVPSQEILLRWDASANRSKAGHVRSPSVFPTYLTNTDELKAALLPNMVGLHRAKHIAAATIAYREAVLREIRNLIRRPLPSSTDDDNESMMSVSTASGGRHLSNQEKSSILARNLRALDPEDGEDLLVKIYIGVTETLRRLTTQVKVLLEITSSLTESAQGDTLKSPTVRSPISSPRPDRFASNPMNNAVFEVQEELHKSLDITNLLGQAVDVAIEKIVKVLKVRAEQTAQLPLTLFLRYFTLNLYFANECESISGRSGTSLKNVVNGHIKDFVQRNRDAEMQKLAQGMESDQWNAKDFDEKNTDLLNTILGSSTHDPQEWTDSTKIWISNSELEHHNEEENIETNGTGKEKTRTATIDSESFMLPKSAILCLEGIAKFSHLINGIPSMTLDIATSLIAYLQLFNSRCTQLILGAGATRSAGLKNITTKHLALASQALSFTATLIPHVREFVRRHAGSGANVSNVMGEFDKIRRLLQEHQDSIYQKLVEIMSGRAAIHSRTMKTIDWEADGGKGVHSYMETLAKETTTLHRVLTKHLPETSIQMIMLPVFSSYRDQLGSSLREADPKTDAGLKSMNNDIEFLTTKLGKLDGFGDTGEYLQKIIKSKQVKTVEPAIEPTSEKKDDESKENETGPSAEAAESTEPAEKKE